MRGKVEEGRPAGQGCRVQFETSRAEEVVRRGLGREGERVVATGERGLHCPWGLGGDWHGQTQAGRSVRPSSSHGKCQEWVLRSPAFKKGVQEGEMAEKARVGCRGSWGSKRRQEARDPFRSRDPEGSTRDLGLNNEKVVGYPMWRVPKGTWVMEVRGGDTPTNGASLRP